MPCGSPAKRFRMCFVRSCLRKTPGLPPFTGTGARDALCSKRLMVRMILVWESFLLGSRGNRSITKSATISRYKIPLFVKRIICHSWAHRNIHNSIVLPRPNYTAGFITKHYSHLSLQTKKPTPLRRNVIRVYLTKVSISSCLFMLIIIK
jgi:hypothetical protein